VTDLLQRLLVRSCGSMGCAALDDQGATEAAP
jgi:hypothetical protein